MLFQQGYQLRPQLEAFKGQDFALFVGHMDIFCRYAKGKKESPSSLDTESRPVASEAAVSIFDL